MKDASGQSLTRAASGTPSLGLPVQSPAIRRTALGAAQRGDAGVEPSFPFAALAPFIPTAVNAISKLF